jgi:Rrf2 family protein
MKLQKSTVFALYAVLELASAPDRQLSTNEIAERYGISTHHLAKVMRRLVRGGLVQSARGAGGGYRFNGNANRTTLLDIITLFEELEPELDLEGATDVPPTAIGGALQDVRDEINDLTRATLRSITIATLIKNAERRRVIDRVAAPA